MGDRRIRYLPGEVRRSRALHGSREVAGGRIPSNGGVDVIGSAARQWLVGQTLTLDADVGIVGAGAAGGVRAFWLARRGVRVVVPQSGPRLYFARRSDCGRRYLKHQNPWETSPRDLDRHTGGGGTPYRLAERRVRGVGGSTLHWEGYAFRLHASDFQMRSLYGIADDWPISYSDLEGYYG